MAAIYYKLCARHCDRQLTYIDSLYSQHSPVKFVIPILQVRKLSFSLPKVTSKEQQGQNLNGDLSDGKVCALKH